MTATRYETLAPREARAGGALGAQVAGAIIGAAVGDALGHPVEFLPSLAEIRREFGPRGVTGYRLFWERGGRRFAPYTDDTQLAELVLRTLLWSRDNAADLDATMARLAKAFVHWAEDPQGGHRAPGNACLAGARRLAHGAPWREGGPVSAGGCGSVMRAYPFGVVLRDDPSRAVLWAVEHSRLTHSAPIALSACAAIAAGMTATLAGAGPRDVLETMRLSARAYDAATALLIEDAVAEARRASPPDEVLHRLRGWAADEAIAAACYVFARHPDDFARATLEAVNSPGDSDSIATLVGALVGGRTGLAGIPSDWIRDLERVDEIIALATAAARPGTRA